jgi:hypothetical protein
VAQQFPGENIIIREEIAITCYGNLCKKPLSVPVAKEQPEREINQ